MAAATAIYRTVSTASTTSTTSTLVSDSSLSQNSRMDDQQFITTFFCRAKYDYQSADDASLSFHRGDIIEVLTRLETGWWDGLLGEERGWFPSNYVDVITDEEADIGLAALELQQQQQRLQQLQQQQQQQQQATNIQLMSTYPSSSSESTSTQPRLSTTSAVAQPRLHNDHRTWPDADTDSSSRNGQSVDELTMAGSEGETLPSDYWVPRVSQDGRVSPFIPVLSASQPVNLFYLETRLFIDILREYPNWPTISRPSQ
jgi:son of sevenless-like protein